MSTKANDYRKFALRLRTEIESKKPKFHGGTVGAIVNEDGNLIITRGDREIMVVSETAKKLGAFISDQFATHVD